MSSKNVILIIDDEDAIREMLRFSLEKHRFKVLDAADCAQARDILNQQQPDLILLDWMLPDQSGIEFAKLLKAGKDTQTIPIVMLTAKAEEGNKVRGLDEAQVDDYVTKPFSPRELIARINAVLRRSPETRAKALLVLHDLSLDFERRQVSINGVEIVLTAKQFDLLHFFLTHRDKVYTRLQLVEALTKTIDYIDERSVDRQIKRLRDVLKPYNYHNQIKTIRGHGYQFVSEHL